MDSKTLFKKLVDFPFEQKKEITTLFSLLSPELHEETIKYMNFMNHKERAIMEKTISALKRENSYHLFIHAREEEYKFLHEICDMEYGEEQTSGEGEFPFYQSYASGFSTSSTFNREGANILIGKFQNSFYTISFMDKKLFLGKAAFSLKAKPEHVLQEFLVLYLRKNSYDLFNCTRNCSDAIDEEKYKSIQLKIPGLKKQEEILHLVKKNQKLINILEQKLQKNEEEIQKFVREYISKLQVDNALQ